MTLDNDFPWRLNTPGARHPIRHALAVSLGCHVLLFAALYIHHVVSAPDETHGGSHYIELAILPLPPADKPAPARSGTVASAAPVSASRSVIRHVAGALPVIAPPRHTAALSLAATTRAVATTSSPSTAQDDAAAGTSPSLATAASPRGAAGPAGAPDLARPSYLQTFRPIYPQWSRDHLEQGRVLLRVEVGADGRVADLAVKLSSGFPQLDRAALDSVRAWIFVPARRGGQGVAAIVFVPVVFKLSDD
jgi:protein TonB